VCFHHVRNGHTERGLTVANGFPSLLGVSGRVVERLENLGHHADDFLELLRLVRQLVEVENLLIPMWRRVVRDVHVFLASPAHEPFDLIRLDESLEAVEVFGHGLEPFGRHALRPFRLDVRASVGAVHTRPVHAFGTGRLDAHRQGRDRTLLGRPEGPVIAGQSRKRDRIGRVQFIAEGLRQVHRFGAKVGVNASADVSTSLQQGSGAFKGPREGRARSGRQDGLQNVVAILRQARGVSLGEQVHGARDSGLNRDLGSDGRAAGDVGGGIKSRTAECAEQSGAAVERLADNAFSFPERIVTRSLSKLLTTGALNGSTSCARSRPINRFRSAPSRCVRIPAS